MVPLTCIFLVDSANVVYRDTRWEEVSEIDTGAYEVVFSTGIMRIERIK